MNDQNDDAAMFVEAAKAGDNTRVHDMLESDPSLALAVDEQCVSALLIALYHGQTDIAEAIRGSRPSIDVFEAAALGDTESVRSMVHTDAMRARQHAADGFTPLHLAAYFGRINTVRALIELGADVNAITDNPSKLRPLHSAAAARNAEIVAELLAAGADPNAPQHGGFTALHSAAMHGDKDMVRQLLKAGAEPPIKADDGRGALDFAREGGHECVIALLSTQPAL